MCLLKTKKKQSTNKLEVSEYIVFDKNTQISIGQFKKFGIEINTSNKQMEIVPGSSFDALTWVHQLSLCIKNSDYIRATRYGSFAPVRKQNSVKTYLNGDQYFSDLYDAIESAEKQILITDWVLSPQIYLKRPIESHQETRLDRTLKRAAERGVKIRVLLYKEFSAMPNDSLNSKKSLEDLHPNIEVMRHPTNIIFFWSHHEKLCIIDQEVSFMGGLDLAFGRMDDSNHHIKEMLRHENKTMFPGQDYSNPKIKGFDDMKDYERCLIDKEDQPRMPWRDIACQLQGASVVDVVRHFIEYWNWSKKCTNGNKNYVGKGTQLMTFDKSDAKSDDKSALTGSMHGLKSDRDKSEKEDETCILEKTERDDPCLVSSKHRILCAIEKLCSNCNKSDANYEIKCSVSQSQIAKERWEDAIYAIMDKNREKAGKDVWFSRMLHSIRKSKRAQRYELVLKPQFIEFDKEPTKEVKTNIDCTLFQKNLQKSHFDKKEQHTAVQILRSAGPWQIGLQEVEKSIQTAYIAMITSAKNFIYIENQYFISGTAGSLVTNQITNVLVQKIISKIKAGEDFKVLVIMPLSPDDDGDLNNGSGNKMRNIMAYHYYTINRGQASIFGQLKNHTDTPEKYIRFLS